MQNCEVVSARPYLPRSLGPTLQRAAGEFPAAVVTGPRQSGETTRLRHGFGGRHAYVSLVPPDVRAAAEADARGFLAAHPPPLILDEIQYTPGAAALRQGAGGRERGSPWSVLPARDRRTSLCRRRSRNPSRSGAVLRLLSLSWREILFETAMVAEVTRALTDRGQEARVRFCRTSTGSEVDLLVEDGTRLVPVKAKASATPRPAMVVGIAALRRDHECPSTRGYVVYGGDDIPSGPHALAWPFAGL